MKLYDILGVDKNASTDDIRRAYKKLAVQNHPDKGGDEGKFKEISAAYEILSDDEKRNQYNQIGDAGLASGGMQNAGAGHPGFNPHDIFQQMFGGGDPFGGGGFHHHFNMHGGHGNHQHIRRNDNMHEIRISLADAFTGVKKSIKIILTKTCCKCKATCSDCQGVGMITEMHRVAIFTQMINRPCGRCGGSGSISKARKDCSECAGKCTYTVDKKQDIDIHKAVTNGYEFRLTGLGEQIQSSKETPGDLVLKIIIEEDKHFIRQDNDLIYKLNITFVESVTGKDISIPHFAGDIHMNIDRFGVIEPGKNYIIHGKGMTNNSNLIIIFNIKYPKKALSSDQRKQLEIMFATLDI